MAQEVDWRDRLTPELVERLQARPATAPPGLFGNLTPDQEKNVESVCQWMKTQPELATASQEKGPFRRARVAKYLKDENWDQEKAKARILAYLKFRKERDMDRLVSSSKMSFQPRALRFFFPAGVHGFAKDGSPIYIMRVGLTLPSSVFGRITVEDFANGAVQNTEIGDRLVEHVQSSLKGRPAPAGVITIVDCSGVTMSHLWLGQIPFYRAMINDEQSNYPEHSMRVVIVRAPGLFSQGFRLFKPLLNEQTLSRIEIHSDGLPRLKELIDEDQLPTFLGGTCKVCVGCCVPLGGAVPERILIPGERITNETVSLPRNGGTYVVCCIISSLSGAVLQWKISSASASDSFSARVYRLLSHEAEVQRQPLTDIANISDGKPSSGRLELTPGYVLLELLNYNSMFFAQSAVLTLSLDDMQPSTSTSASPSSSSSSSASSSTTPVPPAPAPTPP